MNADVFIKNNALNMSEFTWKIDTFTAKEDGAWTL